MDERTVAKPLSGDEIIKSILHKVEARLRMDCFLAAHISYGYYSADIKMDIKFQDTGIAVKGTVHGIHAEEGQEDLERETEGVTEDIKIEAAPPNTVREESEQAIPVQVTTPQGRVEERRKRYAPKKKPATPPDSQKAS